MDGGISTSNSSLPHQQFPMKGKFYCHLQVSLSTCSLCFTLTPLINIKQWGILCCEDLSLETLALILIHMLCNSACWKSMRSQEMSSIMPCPPASSPRHQLLVQRKWDVGAPQAQGGYTPGITEPVISCTAGQPLDSQTRSNKFSFFS